MEKKPLPLKELSIEELFVGGEKSIYEIPIYQRNYAWEEEEITALVQDIYDAYKKDSNNPYYIGTLVSYHKGDRVFEIIDGQQRLTTIRLILNVLDIQHSNQLTYRARKKSDDTLKSIPEFSVDEKDIGIETGYNNAKSAIEKIVPRDDKESFKSYFKSNVHIIHYQVPKDIDLNHYFEIMNSRGEQLEKHEIVKANLMEKLEDDAERKVFNRIWECCSEMSVYTQQNLSDIKPEKVFGPTLSNFLPENFDKILTLYKNNADNAEENPKTISIADIISLERKETWSPIDEEIEKKDSFQPIIDFPNFLLIILKITRMKEPDFKPIAFNLDDKELLNEFNRASMDAGKVKHFAYNLLKGKFFLDNYVVHHSKEEDTIDSNPWKLQMWCKDEGKGKGRLQNLTDNKQQNTLAHLLSMFEVSFTARQRKNYLFYCLFHLLNDGAKDISAYTDFVERLADRYFNKVYLDGNKLNDINTPKPGSFDEVILDGNRISTSELDTKSSDDFVRIYGDGAEASRGVPLFVFNYLDYKLWKLYDDELRGEKLKEGSKERQDFFAKLGCTDFGLEVFDRFYFSRTRRSLEHYYPQATATGEPGKLNRDQINCLGNYAMIGSAANSSGSNWSPETKRVHYLDLKTSQISVASLKFRIMLQVCEDRSKWTFAEIKEHQERMIAVLMENNR